MNKIIIYYQTFCGLEKIYNNSNPMVTHIHLAAIHFGEINNKTYIHLNDNNPNDPEFDDVWEDLIKCKQRGIKIILMVGGAGGAYEYMFSNTKNYNTCISLLYNLINDKKDLFDGIDLDIEESIGLDNTMNLLIDLNSSLPSTFLITMAPISQSLENNIDGLGGFKYSDILNSQLKNRISYLNCQFYNYDVFYYYDDFFTYDTLYDAYNKCINNKVSRKMLVIGIDYIDAEYYPSLEQIIDKGKISGVFFWEYNNIPDDFIEKVYNIMNKNKLKYGNDCKCKCNIL
jgi:hypothetical protein